MTGLKSLSFKICRRGFLSIDKDRTVCKSLEAVRPNIFANGGDRATSEVPETPICKKYNIKWSMDLVIR